MPAFFFLLFLEKILSAETKKHLCRFGVELCAETKNMCAERKNICADLIHSNNTNNTNNKKQYCIESTVCRFDIR